MKKLFSLFGLLGLLAFVVNPIYAQEEQEATLDEQIVAEADDIVAETEDAVEDVAVEIADAEEAVEDTVEDVAEDVAVEIADAEEAVEDTAEDVAEEATEEVEDFAALLNTDEVQNAFSGFTNEETAGIIGIFAGMGIAGLLVALVFGILAIIALWKAFTRAGEGGWKAIIPVYNTYIQFKLADMKNWFWYMILIAFIFGVVAACLPDYKDLITKIGYVVSGIIGIVASFKFARKYGWGVFASILFVLFYPICILVLGFGNYPYEGKKSEETVVEA